MSTRKPTIRRLHTGVSGLDEVLGGGLPEFSFNVIAGAPGCGKTTLAHQIMFALASEERPALYFTVLGEPPLKMLRYQQQFDFFDETKVDAAIRFISLVEEASSGDLDRVLARIVDEVEAIGPAFVFVDSFRSVAVAARSGDADAPARLQDFVQSLGLVMTSCHATTFLIGEYADSLSASPVFTVADGVVWMHQTAQRNSVVRKMEVMKMRGQATLPGLHTFRIDASGVSIFAPPALANAAAPASGSALDKRLPMGVPGLDAMMGGGLPSGYSLLVAGPSGSGKSIMATAFLAEGARRGEVGIIAAFEQRPNRSRGAVMSELIAGGLVVVVDTRAADLSVDEVARLLIAEVARHQASRVVIDSLSGFELALAPAFREDFRESLARMMSALAATGATVLMTSELEDRYNDLRFSPYGTAFLTDAIVVQRYIEVESRLLRIMAVVKVRGSAHSNELRRFEIGDEGIEIGKVLAEYEGLLGGRPKRHASAAS